ncbi:uncharacterized protein LOC105196133 [Solenopsis invicta]|uniref:uncharacterized protein LOC105196133 n=1 Tax=Solenopsis invicta TaxID=13686 RepID=UPI000E33E517|nr:uncharacterized protein LOC105196133 [Solenopsis invicta]
MRKKVTFKEVISIAKFSMFPLWFWPSKNETKLKTFCRKLYNYWCILMGLCLELPSLYGASQHTDDPALLAQTLVMSSTSWHIMFNCIYQLVYNHRIQSITYEMENFCDLMKPHEEVVIQRYIDKCGVFYGAAIIEYYALIVVQIVVLPPLMHQSFPTLVEYPFDVSYQPLKTIIYLQQSIVGTYMGAQLCLNIFMNLLFWFVTARFAILTEELKDATNINSLFKCIKTHQKLLKYATEVTHVLRPFAFSSICCSTYSIIILFVLLITHQPIALVIQFVGLAITCLAEVYMYVWPGENLINACDDIVHAAYSVYNKHSIKAQKCLQFIMLRSQKPVTLSIPCFLDALSNNYFTSYCSTILSYFTTVRVMMLEDN